MSAAARVLAEPKAATMVKAKVNVERKGFKQGPCQRSDPWFYHSIVKRESLDDANAGWGKSELGPKIA
jgi:hypothetical protein